MNELEKYLPQKGDFPTADYWEIHLEKGFSTSVHLKNGKVESVDQNDADRGNVRILKNGGWGFSSFNRLEDIRQNIQMALDYAGGIGGGDAKVASLPPISADLKTAYQTDPASVSLADKVALAQKFHAMLREHPRGDLIEINLGDRTRQSIFLNSEGTIIKRDEVMVDGALRITGMVEGRPETYQTTFRHRIGYEGYAHLESLVPRLLREFDELLSAVQAKGGVFDVILDPRIAGVFAHEAFGHTSEADFFSRDARLADVMRLGKRLGTDAISIYEDPTLDLLSGGTILYDDEGVPGKRTALLDKGVIAGHLHSRETAAMMGEPVSGNARAVNAAFPPIVRMTNTFIGAGDATLEELLKELGNGVMVMSSRGGMGGEDFTFSAMHGFLVENGKVTQPIKNFTLSGNLFETLRNITACSNKVEMFSTGGGCGKGGQMPLPVGMGGPYVLIKNALIGGR